MPKILQYLFHIVKTNAFSCSALFRAERLGGKVSDLSGGRVQRAVSSPFIRSADLVL